jgi:hypothetical protein
MARTKTFRDTITPTGTAHMKRFENFKATVNHNVPALLQLIRPFPSIPLWTEKTKIYENVV